MYLYICQPCQEGRHKDCTGVHPAHPLGSFGGSKCTCNHDQTMTTWIKFTDQKPGPEVKEFRPGGFQGNEWMVWSTYANSSTSVERLIRVGATHWCDKTDPAPPPKPDPVREVFEKWYSETASEDRTRMDAFTAGWNARGNHEKGQG